MRPIVQENVLQVVKMIIPYEICCLLCKIPHQQLYVCIDDACSCLYFCQKLLFFLKSSGKCLWSNHATLKLLSFFFPSDFFFSSCKVNRQRSRLRRTKSSGYKIIVPEEFGRRIIIISNIFIYPILNNQWTSMLCND